MFTFRVCPLNMNCTNQVPSRKYTKILENKSYIQYIKKEGKGNLHTDKTKQCIEMP